VRGEAGNDWRSALRSELNRLFVASVVSAAVVVFFSLGGVDGGLEPSVLVAVVGFFVHRVASLAALAGA